MRKQEFLKSLSRELSSLPKKEREERLAFYSEMIDDRMEEGFLEEDAVAGVGSVTEIATQIRTEFLLSENGKEISLSKRKRETWEIVLLAIGAPIWFSLFVAFWAIIISIFACAVAFAICAPIGIIAGIIVVVGGNTLSGWTLVGGSLILAGFAVFFYYGGTAAAKGGAAICKNLFVKKGEEK